jgi:hypothetical protein
MTNKEYWNSLTKEFEAAFYKLSFDGKSVLIEKLINSDEIKQIHLKQSKFFEYLSGKNLEDTYTG